MQVGVAMRQVPESMISTLQHEPMQRTEQMERQGPCHMGGADGPGPVAARAAVVARIAAWRCAALCRTELVEMQSAVVPAVLRPRRTHWVVESRVLPCALYVCCGAQSRTAHTMRRFRCAPVSAMSQRLPLALCGGATMRRCRSLTPMCVGRRWPRDGARVLTEFGGGLLSRLARRTSIVHACARARASMRA